MPINILYLCSGRGFKSKSLPRKIAKVIESFKKTGNNVFVISGDDIYNTKDHKIFDKNNRRRYNKVVFLSKNIFSIVFHSISEIRDIIHDNYLFSYLDNFVCKNNIDLIWERSSRLHRAGIKISKKYKIPYVLEWKDHLIDYKISLFKNRALKVEKMKEEESSFIVVESKVLKDIFQKKIEAQNRIYVAYNAVDIYEFKPDPKIRKEMRKKLEIKDDDIIIGYAGSYAFYHDSVRMILAIKSIVDKGIRNIKLYAYGYGKDYKKCRRLAEENELLNKYVFMCPPVQEEVMPLVMSSFDIGLLPGSTNIICPIKIFEYMATGLPVILPNYDCNKEIVTDYEEGLSFIPYNEDDLADKILLVAHNYELRKFMGNRAREKVLNNFTWEKTWGNTLKDVIKKLKI